MSSHTFRSTRRRRSEATNPARRSLRALGAAGALLAALAACSGSAAETTDSAADSTAAAAIVLAPQDVAVATVADIVSGITLTGSLEPADRVTVTAQVGGTLGAIAVDRGTSVDRKSVV
jgi:multidrug efflux pump subunit AcrA (membrane-fusion protein)